MTSLINTKHHMKNKKFDPSHDGSSPPENGHPRGYNGPGATL